MATSKHRLEAIRKKLAGRTGKTDADKWLRQFQALHAVGLIRLKDGRIATHREWTESFEEPMRTWMLNILEGKDDIWEPRP